MQIRILLKKMTEQVTLNENVSGYDLNLWNSANGWKKITIGDHGLKRRFLYKWIVRVGISKVIAMKSKIEPGHVWYFLGLWLDLCNNSDQTLFSNTLPFAKSLGSCWKPRPSAVPACKYLLRKQICSVISLINNLSGVWHTLYAVLLSNYKWDATRNSYSAIVLFSQTCNSSQLIQFSV